MTWAPPALQHSCFQNGAIRSCTSPFLTFLIFIIQHMNHSVDDSYKSEENEMTGGNEEYDFIVVGAGTAGCVVVNRLSEVKQWKILLLEAGDEEPLVAEPPGLYSVLKNSSIDYGYILRSEPVLCKGSVNPNGVCIYSAGKVMGGGSTINAMFHVRGNKQDFDNWSKLGNTGWSYDEVLPYFKKSEDFHNSEQLTINQLRNHGTGGYLPVTWNEHTEDSRVVADTWKAKGLQETDYNDGNQAGVSRLQTATFNGSRASTNSRFISPIRSKRSNLSIKTNSRVIKIIIDSRTRRAVGVEYISENSKNVKKAFARKEVIISAGVIQSPKLLMLSGIGPADHLREVGIDVMNDLSVGKNYHDHVFAISTVTFKELTKLFTNDGKRINDLQTWLDSRQGPMGEVGVVPTITFLKVGQNNNSAPNIIVFMSNYGMEIDPDDVINKNVYPTMPYTQGFVVVTLLITPKSRGYIKLDKADPVGKHPVIQGNYLTDPLDVQTLAEGLRQSHNAFRNNRALKDLGYFIFKVPIPACLLFWFHDSEYYKCLAKDIGRVSHHAVGTCKMGPNDDPEAVVNPRLQVYGVRGLRVVDSSVMPVITRGNPNAPVIMIAEKASDMIKQDWS